MCRPPSPLGCESPLWCDDCPWSLSGPLWYPMDYPSAAALLFTVTLI